MRRLMNYLIPVILYVLFVWGASFVLDASIIQMLKINKTLFVLLPLLLILLALLEKLLFRPILDTLERREKVISDARELRDRYGSLAEEKTRVYQEKLLLAKQEAASDRNEGRSRAQADLRAKVQQARDASLAQVEKARAGLAADMEKARAGLRAQAEGLGRELAGSFLGREAR